MLSYMSMAYLLVSKRILDIVLLLLINKYIYHPIGGIFCHGFPRAMVVNNLQTTEFTGLQV